MSLLEILLIIELIATSLTFITRKIGLASMKNRIKKEGYKFKDSDEQKSFLEKMNSLLPTIIYCSLPVVNLIFPFYVVINYEKTYFRNKQDLIAKGKIIKIEDIEQKLIDETSIKENEVKDTLINGIDCKTITSEEMIAYLEKQKEMITNFQEQYKPEKMRERLDKINEQTDAQESKPKTYSIGNNSNLKHK